MTILQENQGISWYFRNVHIDFQHILPLAFLPLFVCTDSWNRTGGSFIRNRDYTLCALTIMLRGHPKVIDFFKDCQIQVVSVCNI